MGLKARRKREITFRRSQILTAARKLLLKRGFAGTSIGRIARAAELGVGTIYFYFESKEAIFIALQEEGLRLLAEKVQAAADTDPIVQLRGIALAYLHFSREHKDYFDIINYFLASPDIVFDDVLKRQIDEYGGRILEHVTAAIEAGVRQALFRPVDARRRAVTLWAAVHGLIQFKKFENTILMGENHAQMVTDAVDRLIDDLRTEQCR